MYSCVLHITSRHILIRHSKCWMPINYDTIEDGQNKTAHLYSPIPNLHSGRKYMLAKHTFCKTVCQVSLKLMIHVHGHFYYLLTFQVWCHLHLFFGIQYTISINIILGKHCLNLSISMPTAGDRNRRVTQIVMLLKIYTNMKWKHVYVSQCSHL